MGALDVVEGAQVGDLELDERRTLLLERLAIRGLAAAGEFLARQLVGAEGDSAFAALRGDVAVAAVHEAHVDLAVFNCGNFGSGAFQQDEFHVLAVLDAVLAQPALGDHVAIYLA